MDVYLALIVFLLFLGSLALLFMTYKKKAALEVRVKELETQLTHKEEEMKKTIALIEQAQKQFSDTFKALSVDALKENTQSFLELAAAKFDKLQEGAKSDLTQRQKAIDEMMKPIKETLAKADQTHNELRKTIATTHSSLSEQVKGLATAQTRLQSETQNLVKALRAPSVRGHWGEMQLKRVVEIAGMLEYCDFMDQQTVGAENNRLRPDMVVNLPGGKQVVVDSKAPLQSYLEAIEIKDEDQKQVKFKEHSRPPPYHPARLEELLGPVPVRSRVCDSFSSGRDFFRRCFGK